MFFAEDQTQRWRDTLILAMMIDDELAEQTAVQTGCEYHRMDECGVSVANTNIVVTQLARRILEHLND